VVQRADSTFDDDLEDWLRRAHNWLAKREGEVNYYQFMRLPMDSTKDDIKKQYRRLCLLWHPDKNPTEEARQRFDELHEAYKFLNNDELRDKYDFGMWKDKIVRHHVKTRRKVKDSWDDSQQFNDTIPRIPDWGYGDKHVEEDDKVECIYWGTDEVPDWLREKRRMAYRRRYGEEPDSP